MADYIKSYGYLSVVQPELRMLMNIDRDSFRQLLSSITPVSENLKLWLFESSFQWSQVVSSIPDYSFRVNSEINAVQDPYAQPKGEQLPESYKIRYKLAKGVQTPGIANMIGLVVDLNGKDPFTGSSIHTYSPSKYTPLFSVGENVVVGYKPVNGQSIQIGYAQINQNIDLETLSYQLEISKWVFKDLQKLTFPELDLTGSKDIVKDKLVHLFQGTEDPSLFYKAKANSCLSYLKYLSGSKKYAMEVYKFLASSSNVLSIGKNLVTFNYLSILGDFNPRNFYYKVATYSAGDATLALYIDTIKSDSGTKYLLKVNKEATGTGTWEEVDITSQVLGIAGNNEVRYFSFLGTLSTNILLKLVYTSGGTSDLYSISSLVDKDGKGRYTKGLHLYKGTLPYTADQITSALHSNYPYIEYIEGDTYKVGIESFTLGLWDISSNPLSKGTNESLTLELNIEDK